MYMKIYFTSATTDDPENSTRIKNVIDAVKAMRHTLTSGEQILESHDQKHGIGPTDIFLREKKAIEEADCMVAEVTIPSSGVGGEIVYALTHDKPVLCLFYKDASDALSPMITGNPSEHLYLEHYDEDSLSVVLKQYLDEVSIQHSRKGKLIVIDGGDGSGKTTQSELLSEFFMKKGVKVKSFDFPRYYSSFHGKVVGRFLAGEFGGVNDVSPYLASLAYALDRAAAKPEMDEWLGKGGTIVCNRYATSNMAHQGARLPEQKRKEFLDWIDELEYKVHKIPREDIVIYLHVPWRVGMELTKKKGFRAYLGGKKDILEADETHRTESEAMYLDLAKKRKNWVVIECVIDGVILTKEMIHEKVLEILRNKKLI